MLFKEKKLLEKGAVLKFEKFLNGEPTTMGAFKEGEALTLRLTLSRKLGIVSPQLSLCRDGKEKFYINFEFKEFKLGIDTYELNLKLEKGLWFYELVLNSLISKSINNLDFELKEQSENPFTLLIYAKEFSTPDFLKGSVMYHIFVDRFFKGKGEVTLHGRLIEDWDSIPDYQKKVGDSLPNDNFYGGNLWGIIEKLDFLKTLSVNVIYLSPIFSSPSNHRYDTSDYEEVDSILGGNKALYALIEEAHKRKIKIILDGVFNHTGSDSRYFNKAGNFDTIGAYQSKNSPYHNWYNFYNFPDEYEAWWGIKILPRLNHSYKPCFNYFTETVLKKWLDIGIDGWRLDVADELSNGFLKAVRKSTKECGDKAIIGEVWENAVTKSAYGERKEYFWGEELDSVMNYPLRTAILDLLIKRNTNLFYNTVTELYTSYPKAVVHSLMNILSTHDTERIITLLGDNGKSENKDNDTLATLTLSEYEKKNAIKLMKIATVIQYTLFGFPSLYYGDERGLEGYHDPFCRRGYPWTEESELIEHYEFLGKVRMNHPSLKDGDFEFIYVDENSLAYRRKNKEDRIDVYVNLSKEKKKILKKEIEGESAKIFE